jgi:hypothetical protein
MQPTESVPQLLENRDGRRCSVPKLALELFQNNKRLVPSQEVSTATKNILLKAFDIHLDETDRSKQFLDVIQAPNIDANGFDAFSNPFDWPNTRSAKVAVDLMKVESSCLVTKTDIVNRRVPHLACIELKQAKHSGIRFYCVNAMKTACEEQRMIPNVGPNIERSPPRELLSQRLQEGKQRLQLFALVHTKVVDLNPDEVMGKDRHPDWLARCKSPCKPLRTPCAQKGQIPA